MTGLDTDNDTILSIACFITGPNLELLDEEGYTAVIHHDKEALDKMGEWCTEHHGSSGLTAAALASTTTAEDAASELLAYVQKYVPRRHTALLAGNTVHMDKMFLVKEPYKPVMKHLHHRILDVSAIKEAARRWCSEEVLRGIPRKKGLHEARQDILESIEEARYYREVIFRKGGGRREREEEKD